MCPNLTFRFVRTDTTFIVRSIERLSAMVNRRSFLFVYSPLLALGLAIVGIFAMATYIGLGLRIQS
jgi:hypothetical protein